MLTDKLKTPELLMNLDLPEKLINQAFQYLDEENAELPESLKNLPLETWVMLEYLLFSLEEEKQASKLH